MELFDGAGNFVGEVDPGSGDGWGCLLGVVFYLAIALIVGPSVAAYYIVKGVTGAPKDQVSDKGFIAAILVGVLWIGGCLLMLSSISTVSPSETQSATTVQAAAQQQAESSEKLLAMTPTTAITYPTSFSYEWFSSEKAFKAFIGSGPQPETAAEYAARMNTGQTAKDIDRMAVEKIIAENLLASQEGYEIRVRLDKKSAWKTGVYQIVYVGDGGNRVVGMGPVQKVNLSKDVTPIFGHTIYHVKSVTFGPTTPQ